MKNTLVIGLVIASVAFGYVWKIRQIDVSLEGLSYELSIEALEGAFNGDTQIDGEPNWLNRIFEIERCLIGFERTIPGNHGNPSVRTSIVPFGQLDPSRTEGWLFSNTIRLHTMNEREVIQYRQYRDTYQHSWAYWHLPDQETRDWSLFRTIRVKGTLNHVIEQCGGQAMPI